MMGLFLIPSQQVSAKPIPQNSCLSLAPLARKAGLPKVFLTIAYRESRCTEKAVGWNYKHGYSAKNCKSVPFKTYQHTCGKYIATFDSGYWQINSSWSTVTKQICGKYPREGALLDGWCNARVAKYLYDNGGLSPWRLTSGSP